MDRTPLKVSTRENPLIIPETPERKRPRNAKNNLRIKKKSRVIIPETPQKKRGRKNNNNNTERYSPRLRRNNNREAIEMIANLNLPDNEYENLIEEALQYNANMNQNNEEGLENYLENRTAAEKALNKLEKMRRREKRADKNLMEVLRYFPRNEAERILEFVNVELNEITRNAYVSNSEILRKFCNLPKNEQRNLVPDKEEFRKKRRLCKSIRFPFYGNNSENNNNNIVRLVSNKHEQMTNEDYAEIFAILTENISGKIKFREEAMKKLKNELEQRLLKEGEENPPNFNNDYPTSNIRRFVETKNKKKWRIGKGYEGNNN